MRTIYVLLIVGSLALHIGIVMVDSVAQIASNVVGRVIASTAIKTVVDTKTVYSKQKNKIIALSDDIKDKNNKLKITKNNLKISDNKIIKQRDEITKLGGKVTNLESDLALKDKELKIAKNAMTTQDGEIAKLNGKVKDLESETIKTSNKLKTANSTITEQTSRINSLTKNNETLELKIKNTPSAKLPTKLAQKNVKAIENTSNNIIGKSLNMVSRNALALPAQAIPFIGILVIVGVTTLDVKASCDIVKELERLKTLLGMHVEAKTDERQYCGLSGKELWKKVLKTPKEAWNTAKEFLPELPDFSNAWDATKEWVSPTYWGTWFTGLFTGWFGEDSPDPEQIFEEIINY